MRGFHEVSEVKREKDIPLKKVAREMLAKEGKRANVADLDRPICKDIQNLPDELCGVPEVDRLPEEIFYDLFKDDFGE